jgi:hypothetical protein
MRQAFKPSRRWGVVLLYILGTLVTFVLFLHLYTSPHHNPQNESSKSSISPGSSSVGSFAAVYGLEKTGPASASLGRIVARAVSEDEDVPAVIIERGGEERVVGSLRLASSPSRARAAISSSPSPSPSAAPSPVSQLLSLNRPVQSDVRGNLGPPEVITNEKVDDWLADRWQAAANMNGDPIVGEHYLEIDLQRACKILSILLDFEDAFSTEWTLLGGDDSHNLSPFAKGNSPFTREIGRSVHHILQEVILPEGAAVTARRVRLQIHAPSTRWGTSLWRMQIWGIPEEEPHV